MSDVPARRLGDAADPRLRRPSGLGLVYAALGTGLVAYTAFLLVNAGHTPGLSEIWALTALEFGGSLLCLARARITGAGRGVALVLGVAMLSWSVGDVVQTLEARGGGAHATPSLSDAFYLGFYPMAYIAIVLFMRGDVRRLRTPSWLDGVVAGSGAATVCAAFVFRDIMRSAGGGALGVATNLAYPVGDLLLLALVMAGTVVLAGRRKAPWFLIAAGCALNVTGDTANLFHSSFGGGHLGTVVDTIAWPAAILLMSGALWLRPRPASPLATVKPPGFLLPGLAATASLGVLLLGTFTSRGRVAIALATLTLLVTGLRLALSVRGLRTLTEERYQQSVTDELTGLGNRRYLFKVLDAFFAERANPRNPERTLAFLFVDLDHFKEINDSFGHPAGDQLLHELGPRMARCVRSTDLLIRLGGDEFAVVMLDADTSEALAVAQRLAAVLEEPFDLDVVRTRIGASIGIALAPRDATHSAGLLWCADVAMYRAKAGNGSFAFFDPDLDDEGSRLQMAEDLRVAVDEGQLVLHYQPQLDLRTGEITGAEALVRWAHPRLGLLPPVKFLPLAEEAGLMGPLTREVLCQAFGQCAKWRAEGRPLTVSVNVSASNLLDPEFVEVVRSLLEEFRVPPDAIVLEITETTVITELDRCRAVIEDLCALGLEVSIDDFGAGYTSLAHLSSLPVKELKLDPVFITGLAERERDWHLVRATIALGHSLGLRIVAEGIEDAATLDLLRRLGCDGAQGYLIGKPKASDEFTLRRPRLALTAAAS